MLKRGKSGNSYKVYLKVLLSVLPIFFVPVIVMIAIYYRSNEVINQQTYEKNLAVLQSSADTIQKTFTNMDNLISYLDRNSSISRFLTSVNPIKDGSTTTDMLNAQSDLRSLAIANDILQNIQIYSSKNDIMIDSATSALYLSRYYNYEFVKDMSFSEWQEKFLKTPHKYQIFPNLNIISGSQAKKRILYTQSLPISESMNITGVILIYLDEEYLINLFKNIPYQKSGFIYILDNNGQTILYNNGSDGENPKADSSHFTSQSGYFSQNIGGKDMFVTYYKGTGKNWVYVAALPKNQVLAPTASIRLYINLLILFCLLSGVILVFYSVTKLSKPITHIFALLAEKNKDLSYNDFEYEISKLVKHSYEMQDALNNQIPELKTSIFYNLLIGGYRNGEEIRHNLSKINIKLDAKFYVVLIASINELDTNSQLEEISAQKIYINSILIQHFENIQGVYNLDFERTVLLLSFDENKSIDTLEKIEIVAKKVVEQFMDNMMMSISFSGDITDDILKIPSSFLNAYTAINYKQKNLFYTVQWFIKAVHTNKSDFYYPIELESQLIAMVNAGNMHKLTEVFCKIDQYNENIIGPDNNPVFNNLLLSMNSTLIRIYNESRNYSSKSVNTRTKITSKLATREDLAQIYYLLKEAFMSIALFNKDEHRQSNNSQHSQILQYIDEHYTDSQLSLTTVADMFHITEVYLSHLFKHISGENFSKYVEKLRLKRAKELIEQGFTINEIAQMAGYNSPQVFRRAYKRNYGGTPTNDMNKKDQL